VSFSWAKWFAVAVLLAAPLGAFANSDHIVGVATIIDGDTIKIHDQRIRLHGVDAPESAQECRRWDGSAWRCGQQATLALHGLIDRRPVTCVQQDVDRYGRVVGKCSVGDTDINV
jgi:endonuclease YncB( thermonuclease family)